MLAGRSLVKRKTLFVLVLSLLLSQMALASYLCPVQTPAPVMTNMQDMGAPCEGMDPVQPVLCHRHIADSGQVVQLAQLVAPSAPALIQVLVMPAVLDAGASVPIGRAAPREAWPPPDPVFLSTLRLRV